MRNPKTHEEMGGTVIDHLYGACPECRARLATNRPLPSYAGPAYSPEKVAQINGVMTRMARRWSQRGRA